MRLLVTAMLEKEIVVDKKREQKPQRADQEKCSLSRVCGEPRRCRIVVRCCFWYKNAGAQDSTQSTNELDPSFDSLTQLLYTMTTRDGRTNNEHRHHEAFDERRVFARRAAMLDSLAYSPNYSRS